METIAPYPHVEKPADAPTRLRRMPRIRVAQVVMDHLAYGWSPEEMCRQHSYLTLAEAYGAMTYYLDHQDEIEREVVAEWQEADRGQAPDAPGPFVVRMRGKGLL